MTNNKVLWRCLKQLSDSAAIFCVLAGALCLLEMRIKSKTENKELLKIKLCFFCTILSKLRLLQFMLLVRLLLLLMMNCFVININTFFATLLSLPQWTSLAKICVKEPRGLFAAMEARVAMPISASLKEVLHFVDVLSDLLENIVR